MPIERIKIKDIAKINIKSEREFKNRAESFAKSMSISLSALVRMAVTEFINNHK